MRILALLIIVGSFVGCNSDQGSEEEKQDITIELDRMPTMPSYKAVIDEFCTNYEYAAVERQANLKFAKKRDGWYVYEVPIETNEAEKEILFWSAEDGYQNLDFPDATTGEWPSTFRGTYNSEKYSFARCAYFGYDGWFDDVIEDYGDLELDNDTLMESLARAYANLAMAFISNQYGYAPSDHSEEFRFEKQSDVVVNGFIDNQETSMELYYGIFERNPKYQTLVGDIFTKYSNEVLHAHVTLRKIAEPQKAREYLEPGLYPDHLMEWVRVNLDACPPNAILITNGDNDTYPLIYLQQLEGYRTDVIVLNKILLSQWAYLDMAMNEIGFQEQPDFAMPEDFLYDPTKQVFYNTSTNYEYVDLGEALEMIYTEETEQLQTLNGDYVLTLPSSSYTYPTPVSVKSSMAAQGLQPQEQINFSISNSYLIVNDLAVMDLIASNWGDRPICMTNAKGLPFDLQPYMRFNGFVYDLFPCANCDDQKSSRSASYVDSEDAMRLFRNADFSGHSEELTKNSRVPYHIYSVIYYYDLVHDALMLNDDLETAREISEQLLAWFPYEHLNYSRISGLMAGQFYAIGETETARAIIDAGIDDIIPPTTPVVLSPEDQLAEDQKVLQYLAFLKQVAEQRGDQTKATEIQALMNSY